jgi:hypothetical protein
VGSVPLPMSSGEVDFWRSNIEGWVDLTDESILAPLDRDGLGVPDDMKEALDWYRKADTSAVLPTPPDEATLKTFLDACPPVRSYVYALELTLYDRSIRPSKVGPAYKAGRNDQMMAVFLPYCDQFLTDDNQQQKGLHEVALAANIPVKVRLFNDFCSSFLI